MDVVLSLEAISHYLDYPAFLTETYRVLRPAGHLLVSDGNNGRNPRISRHCEEIWASHETDPRTTDTRPDDSGDYDPWQLVAHRRRIILDAQPGISDDDSWTLALETSGMVRGEIEAAAARFVTTGETPGRRYQRGTLSVHPGHEMVLERLFDPYELGREIGRLGFRVKVRGHWVDSTRGPLFGAANRLLAAGGPLTIRTARAFRIAAQKC